jgi:hypothetical protein
VHDSQILTEEVFMRRSMTWFLSTALLLSMGTVVAAQEKQGDLLEAARKRQEVAAQALEREIDAALKEADKLKSDPAKASAALKDVLSKLEKDTTLKSERRVSLLLTVKDRIATFETLAQKPGAPPAAEPPKQETNLSSEELLKRDLDAIRALQLEGRIHEANRLAADLVRRYPDSAAAQQARERSQIADSVREAEKVRSEKAGNSVAVYRSNERSAIPPTGDIEYPSNWAKLSEERKKRYGNSLVDLKPREKLIVETLNGTTTDAVQLKDMPFDEVLKLLEKELRLPLVINKSALDELKITYDMTLTVSLPKQVSRRTLLRRVLGELGLTYIVKNENIEVTSVLRAQNELTTRYFDVTDLVRMANLTGWGGRNGQDPVQGLIDFIQATVDPGSWQKNGGPGTITYYAPTRTLIVRNTAEVINAMGGGRAK